MPIKAIVASSRGKASALPYQGQSNNPNRHKNLGHLPNNYNQHKNLGHLPSNLHPNIPNKQNKLRPTMPFQSRPLWPYKTKDYVDAKARAFWFQNAQYKNSWLIYFKRTSNYVFPNWFYQWWDFFGPIPEILHSPTDEGFKIFRSKFDKQKTCVPVMVKFFSIFSLSWVFSWQYNYGKPDHPKAFPILQRHAYVKWWSQFDSSMAYPEKVREWFKNNPKSQKISDPEIASFLNQKAQIQVALAGSQSKQSIKGKLKQILHLLQEDEELSPDEEDEDSPNEDDYFGINLDDD
ncbi:hypothetical protein PIB30_065484 [Stylosanthes scabra]|uniref:Uncharacterized protein n=1 Tax=Stylosanthes scabra TaxID=79078 RepID=A0ABU6RN39_9FABA|nr:hypothetical protein [Stylosanthes scabra]